MNQIWDGFPPGKNYNIYALLMTVLTHSTDQGEIYAYISLDGSNQACIINILEWIKKTSIKEKGKHWESPGDLNNDRRKGFHNERVYFNPKIELPFFSKQVSGHLILKDTFNM